MHDEVLTESAAELFPHLSSFTEFYLAGGTALAFQLGHRRSVDFDLFSTEPLQPRLLAHLKRVTARPISVTYSSPEQLNVLAGDVKVTLLYFPYPVIDAFIVHRGVSLASMREIAAMKAFSIGKRLSYKDYVDWYFMLKEKRVALAEAMEHARKKFSGDFSDRLFLGQLASIREVQTQTIDFLHDAVKRADIEQFLKEQVRLVV